MQVFIPCFIQLAIQLAVGADTISKQVVVHVQPVVDAGVLHS